MKESIGSFIASLRKEKSLTQEQLAEKLGVSNRSVSRWENGYTLPDISIMKSICEEFNITLTELLSGEKQNPENEINMEKKIYLIIDLLQNEMKRKSKIVNNYFVLGFIFMGIILIQNLLLSFDIIENVFLNTIQTNYFILFGVFFEILGFYSNSVNRELTEKETKILIQDENDLQMKTGEEMFQFAKKYQKNVVKQQKRSFEEIAQRLADNEYVIFTMFAEEYRIENQPGPWHVGVAITNESLFICGETISGRLFTRYAIDSFYRDEIEFVRLENKNIVIGTSRGKVVLKGENYENLIYGLEKVLY